MAKQYRKPIPPKDRARLIEEAGGKCANPGCASRLVHIHHIEEWHIYQSNNPKEMIAICAGCHDEVHRGRLSISDETLYRWKGLDRKKVRHDALTIEPSEAPKMLLGTISVTGPKGVVVFELGKENRLSFGLRDGDLYFLNLSIAGPGGNSLIRVIENQVKYAGDPLRYERGPGRFRATVPLTDQFLQPWALERMRAMEPSYASDGVLPLLAIEILEPGVVRVEGVWRASHGGYIVISRHLCAFITEDRPLPIALAGEGLDSVLMPSASITTKALFGF